MANEIRTLPQRAAFDVHAAQDLREQLRKDPKAGLQGAAQQFEAMFLQMVLKSMRDTVPSDGLLHSDQTRFYNGLLDQQLAQNLAGGSQSVGFAKLIEQQLGRSMGADAAADDTALPDLPAILAGAVAPPSLPGLPAGVRFTPVLSGLPTSAAYAAQTSPAPSTGKPPESAKEFAEQLWPHAVEASRMTGIAPQFVLAHAALESGWGKHQITRPDGSTSHNLFGIKAGRSWSGEVVEVPTTEYINGKRVEVVEKFRAYGSYTEAFRDYASLMRNNPRYSEVIGSQSGTEFARRVQQAGYATDPMYAEKLSGIINGPTLRQALIG
jgi:peptidoglycan hydrolase FlgJ